MSTEKLQKTIEYLVIILVFLLPLSFIYFTYDIFELPKVVILRFFTFLVLLFIFLKILKEGKFNLRYTYYDLPIFFTVISLFISSILSTNLRDSFYGEYLRRMGFINILNIILFYYIIVFFFKETQIKKIIISILISSFIISLYTILQFLKIDLFPSGGKIISTFGNPVFLAGFLIMVIPLSLGMYFLSKNYTGKS